MSNWNNTGGGYPPQGYGDYRDDGGWEGEETDAGEEDEEEQYMPEVWDAIDSLEQVRPTINAGPRWKLEAFLEAVDVLQEAQEVLEGSECHRGMRDAEALLGMAMSHLLEEFKDAVGKTSKPLTAAMLREVAGSARAGQLVETPAHVRPHSGGGGSSSSPSSPASSGSSSPTSSAAGGATALKKVSAATQLALQDWLSAAAVPFLHRMACKLLTGGEAKRTVEAYVSVRTQAIQHSAKELDIRTISKSDVAKLSWPDLEQLMKGWIRDMRTVIVVLLCGERTLCDEIFDGLEPERERCFVDLVRESGLRATLEALIVSAHSIALGQNCPERLFALLDMFTCVRELKAQLECVATVPGFAMIVEDMEGLPRVLAQAVRETLNEFQSVLEQPPSLPSTEKKKGGLLSRMASKNAAQQEVVVPEDIIPAGGAVHPVTSYVVNYIGNFLDRQSKRNYPGTLEYLLLEYTSSIPRSGASSRNVSREHQGPAPSPKGKKGSLDATAFNFPEPSFGGGIGAGGGGGEEVGSKTSLTAVTACLLKSLVSSLEARARVSSDPLLSSLFLFNNVAYIYRHISDSKYQSVLADIPEWKEGKAVEAQCAAFEVAALAKVLETFQGPAQAGGPAPNTGSDVKNRLKRFNTAFEELAIRQAGWAILDEEWRKKARTKMAQRLKDAYAAFLLPHKDRLCEYRSYRYSPNAVERMVLDYFFLAAPTRMIL